MVAALYKRAIASERMRVGMTQEELANQLGVSLSTVHCYEHGKRKLSDDMLVKLANLFGCSTDYLLGRTDERLPRG